MDMGKIKPIDARYLSVRIWLEDEFQYADFLIHAGRSGVTRQEIHNPPLQIVVAERTF